MSSLPGADAPMTAEELRDTIASAITSHSHRSGPAALNWELDLTMSAVEEHVALRLREQADKLDDRNAADLLRAEADRLKAVSKQMLHRAYTDHSRDTSVGQTPPTEGDQMT